MRRTVMKSLVFGGESRKFPELVMMGPRVWFGFVGRGCSSRMP